MPLIVAVALACLASAAPPSAQGPAKDLAEVVRGAERIVIGRVAAVSARFGTNEYGDQLIVSDIRIDVEEVLKGPGGATALLELEGGRIGDLTLDVSDLPSMTRGERAVFFLVRSPSGKTLPYGRGDGIKKLDANGRVSGGTLTVGEIRRLTAAQR